MKNIIIIIVTLALGACSSLGSSSSQTGLLGEFLDIAGEMDYETQGLDGFEQMSGYDQALSLHGSFEGLEQRLGLDTPEFTSNLSLDSEDPQYELTREFFQNRLSQISSKNVSVESNTTQQSSYLSRVYFQSTNLKDFSLQYGAEQASGFSMINDARSLASTAPGVQTVIDQMLQLERRIQILEINKGLDPKPFVSLSSTEATNVASFANQIARLKKLYGYEDAGVARISNLAEVQMQVSNLENR